MAKHKVSNEELLQALKEQLYFLDVSLSNFSNHSNFSTLKNKVIGNTIELNVNTEIESKRIATLVRVLIHDTVRSIPSCPLSNESQCRYFRQNGNTKGSTSLLALLGRKSINFIDSSSPNDGKLHSMTGMVGVRESNSNQYLGLVAKVNSDKKLIAVPLFEQHLPEWYKGYPKIDFDKWWGKEVIKINGHGSSRKDIIINVANQDGGAHVDPSLPFEYHELKNSKLTLNIKGIDTAFERNIVYASVAQIGWELLNSIE